MVSMHPTEAPIIDVTASSTLSADAIDPPKVPNAKRERTDDAVDTVTDLRCALPYTALCERHPASCAGVALTGCARFASLRSSSSQAAPFAVGVATAVAAAASSTPSASPSPMSTHEEQCATVGLLSLAALLSSSAPRAVRAAADASAADAPAAAPAAAPVEQPRATRTVVSALPVQTVAVDPPAAAEIHALPAAKAAVAPPVSPAVTVANAVAAAAVCAAPPSAPAGPPHSYAELQPYPNGGPPSLMSVHPPAMPLYAAPPFRMQPMLQLPHTGDALAAPQYVEEEDDDEEAPHAAKKFKHNVAERRRTSRLNSLFEEVASLLSSRPDIFCDSGSRHSKADLLINSINCMRALYSRVDQLTIQLQHTAQYVNGAMHAPMPHPPPQPMPPALAMTQPMPQQLMPQQPFPQMQQVHPRHGMQPLRSLQPMPPPPPHAQPDAAGGHVVTVQDAAGAPMQVTLVPMQPPMHPSAYAPAPSLPVLGFASSDGGCGGRDAVQAGQMSAASVAVAAVAATPNAMQWEPVNGTWQRYIGQ